MAKMKYIHLSHNDLDGYGCSIIDHIMMEIVKDNVICEHESHNTPKLNEVENTLTEILKNANDDITKSGDEDELIISLLITDIGNVTIEMLNKIINETVRPDVTVMVTYIDHHRSKYLADTEGDEPPINDDIEYIKYEGGREAIFYTRPSLNRSLTFDISYTKSASKILFDMLFSGPPLDTVNYIDRMKAVISYINDYDTGHAGNWYIKKQEGESDIDYIKKIVPTALNDLLGYKKYQAKEGLDRMSFVDIMIHYIKDDMPENIHEDDLPENIMRKLVEFSEKRCDNYDAFLGKIKTDASDISEDVKSIYEEIGARGNYNIHIADIPKEDKTVSHTLFSQKYLPENPDVDILMFVLRKYNAISLRTNKDDINLAEIAMEKNGGGHPKAAGFPIP